MSLPSVKSARSVLGGSSAVIDVSDPATSLTILLKAINIGDNDAVLSILNQDLVRPSQQLRHSRHLGGRRPLEVAAERSNEFAVKLLLDKGFVVEHLQALVSARPESRADSKATPPPPTSSNSSRRAYKGTRRISPSSSKSGSPTGSGGASSSIGRHSPGRHSPGSGAYSPNSSEGVYTGSKMSTFALASSKSRRGSCTSPLMWGCYRGNLAIVYALLRAGFDPAYVDTEGNTALHLAATACSAKKGNHQTILEILISENMNVFQRNMFGNTALQLATDPCAKKLLRMVMEKSGARPPLNLLSLSAMVSAEENLQRLLQEVQARSKQEENEICDGFDVFVNQGSEDALAGATQIVDSNAAGLSSSNQPSKQSNFPQTDQALTDDDILARRVRSRLLRTRGSTTLVNTLIANASELEAALEVGRSCFISPIIIKMATKLLRRATYRNRFEQDILSTLGVDSFVDDMDALQRFAACVNQASSYKALPKHVHVRAQQVLTYAQARTALQAHFLPLEAANPHEVTFDQVNTLEALLNEFQAVRIVFDPRKKRLQKLRDAQALANTNNAEDEDDLPQAALAKKKRKAKGAGKKGDPGAGKGKSKAGASKKGKTADKERSEGNNSKSPIEIEEKETDNQAVEKSNVAEDLARLLASPHVEDDDDALSRQVQACLKRLKTEVELVDCIQTENIGAQFEKGSSERVVAIDAEHRRLDALLKHCEAMLHPSEENEGGSVAGDVVAAVVVPFTVNEDILLQAQARFKQLTRELKIAKKHLAERLKKNPKAVASASAQEATKQPKASKRKKK